MFIFHYGNHIISFLAGCSPAADKETLQKLQITHIVNLASLFGNRFPESFTYLKIEIEDSDDVDIKQPIYRVLRFIESTLTLGGRVLIHCNAGVSSQILFNMRSLFAKSGLTIHSPFKWESRMFE